MKLLLAVSRAIDRMNRGIGRMAGWLTLGMVLLGAFNALARYFGRFGSLQLSSNGLLEAQWYLFSLVFLLGAAATLEEDRHVRVDVLFGRLGPRARAWIDIAGTLIFLLPFCVFALIFCAPSVLNSLSILEGSPDPGGLPRYPIKLVILISFGLLFLQGISELIKRVQTLREVE